jgi:DNA-binding transcriptional MerR regulator
VDGRAGRDELLTIGQVSERTGLSVHALRFYEREGLLTEPVGRTADGRRVYSPRDVEWIANCTRFRASGMPLASIRRFAELVRAGAGTEAERLELLREHRQVVLDRMAELAGSLDLITRKIAAYEDGLARGEADRLWRGPGPAAGAAG